MKRVVSVSVRRIWLCLGGMLLSLGPVAQAAAAGTSAHDLGIASFIAPVRPDTFLHAFGGAMVGLLAASIAVANVGPNTVAKYPLFLPAIGFSTALTAGIAKETLDSTGFGDPQWSDIVHTIIGGIVAAGLIAGVELSPSSNQRFDTAYFAIAGASLAVPVGAAFANEIHLYLERRKNKK